LKSIAEKIIPFLFLGIMLVVLAFGILLFSYVLILGALVGFVLYIIAIVRDKFFSSKHVVKTDKPKNSGRIIDHDDTRQ
jgi:hypothetical protein